MPKWIQWFGYDYHIYIYILYMLLYIYIYTLRIIFIKICFRGKGCIFFLDLLALKVVSLGSPWAIGLYLWGMNKPAKNFGNEWFQMMIFLSIDEFQTSFSRGCVHVRVLFLPIWILAPIPKKPSWPKCATQDDVFEPVASLHGATKRELGGNANSAVKSFKQLGECCCVFFLVGPYFLYLWGAEITLSRNAETSQLISDRGRLRTGLKYLLKFWRFLQSSFSTKSASGANWQIERFQFEFVCKFWKLIN